MKQQFFEIGESLENPEDFTPQETLDGADLHFYPLDEWGDRSYAARSQDRLSDGLTFETLRRVREGGLIIISLSSPSGGRPTAGRSAVAAARVRSVQQLPNGRYFASVRFDFETHLAGNIDAFQL